jgi:hypothetical protein
VRSIDCDDYSLHDPKGHPYRKQIDSNEGNGEF